MRKNNKLPKGNGIELFCSPQCKNVEGNIPNLGYKIECYSPINPCLIYKCTPNLSQ
jgi:hypothetical protein